MGFPTQENREIRLSGDRENDLVPSTVARWYDFRKPGGYLGNVGLWRYELREVWSRTLGCIRRFTPLALACFYLAFTSIAMAQSVPTERYLSFGEELDGVGDYVRIDDSSALDLTNGRFTISALINPTGWGQNNQGRIVDHGGGSSGSSGWSLHVANRPDLGTSEALRFQVNASSLFSSNPNVITLNVWQHIAVTFDAGTLIFYVGGIQQGIRTGVPTPVARAGPIDIGKRSTDMFRFYDGGIDELSIWNRALSQQEIQANMNVELAGSELGLIAYYRFNEGTEQAALDASGNGRDGTLGSTTGPDGSDPTWIGSPTNSAPTVNAGPDQTIALSINFVTLDGSVSDDGLPSGADLSIAWFVDSGPGTVTFDDPLITDPTVTFSDAGVYVLELVADDTEFSANDFVTITVDPQSVLTSIVVSPDPATVLAGQTQQFTAEGFDQGGSPITIFPQWTATGGGISQNGFYTADLSPGQFSVTATDGTISGQATVFINDPSGVWPTNGWMPATPAEMNMDQTKLEEARDYSLLSTTPGSGYITRGGRLVMSWGDNTPLPLLSTTKSIGVTVLGLAIQDGLVNLSDFAEFHLPEIGVPPDTNIDTGWLDDITILQLATQTAGFDKPGGFIDLLFEPGTAWAYTDGGPNWLADLLTVEFGQDLRDLMFARVFDHLGIDSSDISWRNHRYRPDTIDGIKRREFGSGITANVDAMARIGYLYLRGGEWEGQEIISQTFVDMVRTTVPAVVGLPVVNDIPEYRGPKYGGASNHYGLLWWNNADGSMPNVPVDAFWSFGLFDSLIVVIPSLDIVVSRAAGTGGSWPGSQDPTYYNVIEPFIEPIAQSVLDGGGPGTETVPDVVGLSQASAEAAITGANLTVGAVTQENSDTVPEGNVISQSPTGGTSVAAGSPVDLVVSDGPGTETVPDVVGLPQASAEAAITGAGLTVGAVTTQSSGTVPVGDVISQSPLGGTSAAAGSAVDLVVSSGPAVSLTVTSISPDTVSPSTTFGATVTGTGFAGDAQISFTNGSGPAPAVTSLTVVSPTTLSATIRIKRGGPKRSRIWDLTVISGGSSATLANALTIVP